MSSHGWRLSPETALDSVLTHGTAGDENTARRHAFDAAEDLLRAGHVAPFAVLVDDAPAAHFAPARAADGQANIAESLAVLASVRIDLQVGAR